MVPYDFYNLLHPPCIAVPITPFLSSHRFYDQAKSIYYRSINILFAALDDEWINNKVNMITFWKILIWFGHCLFIFQPNLQDFVTKWINLYRGYQYTAYGIIFEFMSIHCSRALWRDAPFDLSTSDLQRLKGNRFGRYLHCPIR